MCERDRKSAIGLGESIAGFFDGEYIDSFTWLLLQAILWVEVEVEVED